VVSLVTYALHGRVDWMLGISLAIGGLFGVGWGVRMAHALPERALVLPAIAGAITRVSSWIGRFHGSTASRTPIRWNSIQPSPTSLAKGRSRAVRRPR